MADVTVTDDGKKVPRVSIKEISRLTGFSITTVSMVINGRASEFSISDATRDLILQTAKQHNYQPNLHARSLRTRVTDIVGLIVPTLKNQFFSEMAETFESLARTHKKFALISVTHYDKKEEINAIRYFLSQNANCIFVANPMATREIAAFCSRVGTQYIFLDTESSVGQTVTTDNFDAARQLTTKLLDSMHAAKREGRIYYVGGMSDHKITLRRLEGFKAALYDAGIPFSDNQFVPTYFDGEYSYYEIRALFSSRNDIGGIFINSLLPMEGMIRFFPEAPELCRDVHYGVFDYHPIMNLLADLRVLIVRQNSEQMMKTAYDLYQQNNGDTRQYAIPYEILMTPAMRHFINGLRGLNPS